MKNPFSFVPTEMVVLALDNVRAYKFRSFLTVLGIVIGVGTVIVIASILTGMRGSIVSMVEDYGTNNIYAFHLSTGPRVGDRDRSEYDRKPLAPEDGEAILELAPSVDGVADAGFVWSIDKKPGYKGETYRQGRVRGVTANYAEVCNLSIGAGRFISEVDDSHRRDVMVIGVNVADALFHGNDAVGAEVEMGGRAYEVIGVLQKRKSSLFGENREDNAVFIPYETGRKVAPGDDYLMLMIRARAGRLEEARGQVEEILRRRRGVKFDEPDNFDLSTADKIIQQFDGITAMVGLIAIALSGVGLLVGGIGVMNIMLVSVTERTREIGVRKAIGARRKDIVWQFLLEAMTLTFLGGALGVILAVGVSYIIIFFVPSLPASVPLWAVVTGLAVSVAVGLLFGVWPARKASMLDPIEALRYE